MALNIENPQAERLAHEVAQETGETLAQVIIHALEERLEKLRGRKTRPGTVEVILEISRRCSALPDLDPRNSEQILGYDESGMLR